MTATESNFLVYMNCGLYMERLIFHQDIWNDNVKNCIDFGEVMLAQILPTACLY